MELTAVVWIACVVIAYAVISRRSAGWPISGPIVFVALGFVLGGDGLDLLELEIGGEEVVVLAEITLAVLLFSDAARADPMTLAKEFALPARLLGIGLPLTIALGTVMTALLLTDLSLAEAALVAAILAPTDAALGQPVVTDHAVPSSVRETLNVESGLNDGLVVPVVTVFLAITERGDAGDASSWVALAAEQIGYGTLVGFGVALTVGTMMLRAGRAGWVEPAYGQLAMLAIAIGCWALATSIDGNGFIAAFVAGLTIAVISGGTAEEHVVVAEDVGQLLALIAFVVFGATFVGPALEEATALVVVCALGTLTVGRMLPVAIALIGSGLRTPTVAFIGWFGPRGLASILFGLVIVTESEVAGGDELFAVITFVVLASTVLHGVTAAPLARRYGAWYAAMLDDGDDMMESDEAPEPRLRWRRRGQASTDGPRS
ncbi:MAG: cation:proton antiporter [Actinomycetota bacterium]